MYCIILFFMPVQRLKVAILPLDLPCSGPVTHSGEILTTGKSQYFIVILYHNLDLSIIKFIIIIMIIINLIIDKSRLGYKITIKH